MAEIKRKVCLKEEKGICSAFLREVLHTKISRHAKYRCNFFYTLFCRLYQMTLQNKTRGGNKVRRSSVDQMHAAMYETWNRLDIVERR